MKKQNKDKSKKTTNKAAVSKQRKNAGEGRGCQTQSILLLALMMSGVKKQKKAKKKSA
jgi:hypothetical protein